MSTDKATPKRHPLAIAWDEWLASPQGQGCANFTNLTAGPFLENRLQAAFNAGATHLDEVVAALEDVLRTGLNGGDNMRLAYIAASRKALTDDLLAKAELSEQAVQRARKALAAVKNDSRDQTQGRTTALRRR